MGRTVELFGHHGLTGLQQPGSAGNKFNVAAVRCSIMAATQQAATGLEALKAQTEELLGLAADHEEDYREKLAEAQQKLAEEDLDGAVPLFDAAKTAKNSRNEALMQLRQAIDAEIGATGTAESNGGAKSGGVQPKHGGAKPGPKAAVGGKPQPKHGGVRPMNPALAKRAGQVGGAKPAVQKLAKVAPDQRNYQNEIKLPAAVWDALDRDPTKYKGLVDGYPEGAVGLKVSEIKEVIEHEKKWVSSSDNPSPQIQQVVGNLRHEGKLARNDEDKRYFIVDGADLDGPPLNEDGSPMEEQEDGTFKTKAGATFTWTDGKVYKKRRKAAEAE